MISIKEYKAFHDAKQRCTNKNHKRYLDWGGRGIDMRFSSFQEFFDELGKCPAGYSLDRIDNNKSYEKGNVKWSSAAEQQHNKRVSKHNKYGITDVRICKAQGSINPTYQAHMSINKQFIQLYAGPDYFEACCARKSRENQL